MWPTNKITVLLQRFSKVSAYASLASILTFIGAVSADSHNNDAWFGITLPPPLDVTAPVLMGERGAEPVQFPKNQKGMSELSGTQILTDVAQIIEFSHASRTSKEIGIGQFWGRISGFPSGDEVVDWAANKFEEAGVKDIRIQPFHQTNDAIFWLPLSWEMTLLANPAVGVASQSIQLHSATPLPPSNLPDGGITAELIFVGSGESAVANQINVRNKIALQKVKPQAHTVFERRQTTSNSQMLFNRGALAVINIIDLPGNMHVYDFRNCGGPCFNLGARDGRFLIEVLNQATEKNIAEPITMKLALDSKEFNGLKAKNAVAVIPGRGEIKTAGAIVINAHADAWFDGAGDNADGLAVLVALAKHFGQTETKLDSTIVLIASAGHHTSGLNGPRNAVASNPDVMEHAKVVINLEHIAQRNVSPARQVYDDGYRYFTADANEAPIVAGVSNASQALESIISNGVNQFGINITSAPSTMASGEGGGFRSLNKAIVTFMQASPLYHTSGETIEIISEPGLEKMAHFLVDMVNQIDELDISDINP